MPICERDSWRLQFFEKAACPANVLIPTDDGDCWDWYPEQRWIYDKLKIAQTQGIRSGLHDAPPKTFPVFSKPNINLKGMGIEGKAIFSHSDFETFSKPGHMWMELFDGEHISTDCAIVNGQVKWCRHATGLSWHEGMFKHWVIHTKPILQLEYFLNAWIVENMANYTGMMNFETINGHIIETHLRFADQWCDLYGPNWLQALVGLYTNGIWELETLSDVEGYSVPLFSRHGGPFRFPTKTAQSKIRALPFIKSLQVTFHELQADELHAMPPGGFRLGIINCTNLEAGLAARKELAACFPNADIMIPD